ncbi:MAG: class B sortase [Lachnospiraceae bacterium]|nr:class B sortase [Lachnospiraceae bacterium]
MEQAKKNKISLKDFDPEMQKQIKKELQKREKRRKRLTVFCSLAAVCCIGYFGFYYYMTYRTENYRNDLAERKENSIYTTTVTPSTPGVTVNKTTENIEIPDILKEYQSLYNSNKSLVGWIKIEDTKIDYPVMQTVNNDYYLTHDFDQNYDKNGSIFLDTDCSLIPRSTNLIVYGHHMKSGRMFGELDKYSQEEFWAKHPSFTFDTIYEKGTYLVMYVFRSHIYKEDEIAFKYYQFIDVNSETEFNSNMNEMAAMSLYDTGVTAQYGDQILTLSTCDSSQDAGRFVVVAKKLY